jgi:probable rRNA maturation factor
MVNLPMGRATETSRHRFPRRRVGRRKVGLRRKNVEISLYNRQRKVAIPFAWLQRFAPMAMEECVRHPRHAAAPLLTLREVEVTFVSDATIARVHRDFMEIPGATDVITFDHGEIVISTETARDNANLYGRPLDEELARYIVHGLLHLNGFEDETEADAAEMHRLQEKILAGCLATL